MGQIFGSLCGGGEAGRASSKKYQVSGNGSNATPATIDTELPSWEKRKKLDYRDFLFSKIRDGQTVWKAPGSIQGQAEMVVEDCEVLSIIITGECLPHSWLSLTLSLTHLLTLTIQNSNIFILDHSVQVTVDDCKNCIIFIGPSEGRWVHRQGIAWSHHHRHHSMAVFFYGTAKTAPSWPHVNNFGIFHLPS